MACKIADHAARLVGLSKLAGNLPIDSHPFLRRVLGCSRSGVFPLSRMNVRPIVTSSAKQEQPASDVSVIEVDKNRGGAPAPRRPWRFDSPITPFYTSYPFPPSRNARHMMDAMDRLVEWDAFSPARNFRQMIDAMDRFLDASFFNFSSSVADSGRIFQGGWDGAEDEEAYYVRVAMPGFGKEDVEVAVEDDELVIKGRHNDEEGDEKWESSNFNGSYDFRVDVPDDSQTDQIKARMKNGVLTVTLPKNKGQRNKQIIDVQYE